MIKRAIKKILKTICKEKTIEKLRRQRFLINNLKLLVLNYWIDLKLFYLHSNLFKIDSFKKIEANIILDYHSIEKGLIFQNTKPRFGKERIVRLHENLKKEVVQSKNNLSQIKVAYKIMCQYFELHQKLNYNISDYYNSKQYEFYKEKLNKDYSNKFEGAIDYDKDIFYLNNEECFEKFSYSRKSIRNFTGEKIDISIIEKSIKLAINAPSVCNRQSSKVYLLQDKKVIDEVLKIQGGMKGYTKKITQLLILTSNRNFFYSVGERNQLYIDGGLFLMNLLYSLHYYKIANCPANWGKTIEEERILKNYVEIPESEKIIAMIPIGVAEQNFRIPLSKRRNIDEVFEII
jgi:nitroreductase